MRFLLPFLCFLSFHWALNAQVATAPAPEVNQENFPTDTLEKSLLWEISGNELQAPSYLYGTIHMIAKDDFFLTDATKQAFDQSQRVTFEINMEDMNNMGILLSLIGQVMMDGGTTLKDLLTVEEYAMVKEHFNKAGMPLFLFERVKPMFLSSLAGGDMGGGDLQSGAVVSYEMEFMEMAKPKKKEMAGLETIEYQMSIFDSIPYKAQAQMLVESIQAGDAGSDELDEMVKLYKDQDLAGMQKMFKSEEGGIGEYEDVMLTNRNRNWIPIMGKMMTEKITFFAVGAGHLGGETGVINLLRKEGYSVRPLF